MPRPTLSPREAAARIIRRLREAGHTAYLAGGCVRDALLGMEPKDYDIATDARPEQVHARFKRSKYVGEAFGVVLVYEGGQAIEVATFRTEWGYADGRRPDEVVFTDAEHDARRRDLTINGLFADPLDTDPETGGDRIIDYVGGREDLSAGRIRAIGDPSKRFGEDYLRMLRAVRFAARLGYAIEDQTAAAIASLSQSLSHISRERIGQEVQWMLTGPAPARAAALIQRHALDAPVLNEAHDDPPLPTLESLDAKTQNERRENEPTHTQATATSDSAPVYPRMLAAWLIDRHLPDTADDRLDQLARFAEAEASKRIKRWRKALCLSNDDRDRLEAIIQTAARAAAWPSMRKAQRKRLLATADWPAACRLFRAIDHTGRADTIDQQAAPLFDEGVAPEPLITGSDLIELGFQPGPRFGRLLEAAYDAQLEREITTRDQAIDWLQAHARAL